MAFLSEHSPAATRASIAPVPWTLVGKPLKIAASGWALVLAPVMVLVVPHCRRRNLEFRREPPEPPPMPMGETEATTNHPEIAWLPHSPSEHDPTVARIDHRVSVLSKTVFLKAVHWNLQLDSGSDLDSD